NMSAGGSTNLDIHGDAGMAADAPISLDIKGGADLALLDPFLAVDGRRARGKLTFATHVGGTRAAPQVTGSGKLADGEFQDYLRGLQVQAIAAAFEAQGNVLHLTQFQARAGNGTLSGSDSADLSGAVDLETKAQ